MGDSRGHWEGNTLVVETTNLTDRTSIGLNGNGLRHSADMKIVERFTRAAADELEYFSSHFTESAPTRAHYPSCALVPPETPIAPTTFPSMRIGTPRRSPFVDEPRPAYGSSGC